MSKAEQTAAGHRVRYARVSAQETPSKRSGCLRQTSTTQRTSGQAGSPTGPDEACRLLPD